MSTPTVQRGNAKLMQNYSSMSSARVCQALGLYKLKKVIEAQLSIAIGVSLLDHLFDLFVGNLLAQIVHDVFQLAGADAATLVSVEDHESLTHLLHRICVLQL